MVKLSNPLFCDVDDTLVDKLHRPILSHIKQAMDHTGALIVWSQRGAEHALKICVQLGIKPDIVMDKPTAAYLDDKDVNEWWPNRTHDNLTVPSKHRTVRTRKQF